jgi:hypothetical protein
MKFEVPRGFHEGEMSEFDFVLMKPFRPIGEERFGKMYFSVFYPECRGRMLARNISNHVVTLQGVSIRHSEYEFAVYFYISNIVP